MRHCLSTALRYTERLRILDQTYLPHEERWLACERAEDLVEAIRSLRVRGAPLIGVAAALMLGHLKEQGLDLGRWREKALELRGARPTAVNLQHAVDRILSAPERAPQAAVEIFDEDVACCEALSHHGSTLLEAGDTVLTHCNAGALATAGRGTAIGVIHRAFELGKPLHVFVDETRPLLQGARLTTWELGRLGIPHTLICDNMAASLMAQGKIRKVVVGADRIARNGDFANKIGTYNLAILAHHHGIPFYVAAPSTTLDPHCPNGKEIPIEERSPSEVSSLGGNRWAPATSPVFNPAFDVTPGEWVTAFILETGVYRPQALAML